MTESPHVLTQSGTGFGVMFANSVYVSVQFGPGNYCANRDDEFKSWEQPARHQYKCANAEVAVIDYGAPGHPWITDRICKRLGIDDSYDVVGYITPDDIGRILDAARRVRSRSKAVSNA